MLTTILTSTAVVTLAEIGDKTMLLAILLAARLRAPWAIVAGILCATIANHLASAFIGSEVAGLLDAPWFRLAVALGFLAMAGWTLTPDHLDEAEAEGAIRASTKPHSAWNAFLTTLVSFFLVEMGDKTQIATIALAARYHDVAGVASGTTLGMMLADAPAVFLGDAITRVVPLWLARLVAAALFAGIGLWQLASALGWI